MCLKLLIHSQCIFLQTVQPLRYSREHLALHIASCYMTSQSDSFMPCCQ